MSLPPSTPAIGGVPQGSVAIPGLYDRPVLAIDLDMHTAMIREAAVDATGCWAVTGSDDKTVRVWSVADGALLRTIRLPAGPGNVGRVYAVAISPDGALIAAGGWTRGTNADRQQQIYLFDRETDALVQRIEGLPGVVRHLTFSPDGRFLAATIGNEGVCILACDQNWAEVARDFSYGNPTYGAVFAPDNRLATTAYGGTVRLYAAALERDIRPTVVISAAGSPWPYRVAFSPDGTRLAVGYNGAPSIDLLDGHTLASLRRPDLGGISGGDLPAVAWSEDGHTLFAAGSYGTDNTTLVLAWSGAGMGVRRGLPAGIGLVVSLVPLPEGGLLVAAADPWLARLQMDGSKRWVHEPPQADFRNQWNRLSVSSDGAQIDFGFERSGNVPARFDLKSLKLNPSHDSLTASPRQDGVVIGGDKSQPIFDGCPLDLDQGEGYCSFAVHPGGDRFVLGADWSLRAFVGGTQLWRRAALGAALAVNITRDGRLVVATYSDGTIRWHRMADGAELLALMPLPNQTDPGHPNWVAWTPEGFYAASEGARSVLRWHVNHGWDAPAESVPVADIPGSFRPAVLPLVLQELETPRALGLAELAQHNREVAVRTHSEVRPGARLYLLAIGISVYNEDYAKNLRLHYADRDARDLANAVVNTQVGLYSRVIPQVLLNQDANKEGILQALETMRAMAAGGGGDLAVVHFSGHGALVSGKLYLLPYEIKARNPVGIRANGLAINELRDELLKLAEHGRVLVLLDACHSGATTMDGAPLSLDPTALRTTLAAANVTVLTSCSDREVSREDSAWQHGALTKVLLDALTDPAADIDRNGLINTNGLAQYVATRVSSLTGNAQTPGMEIRFHTTVFASGLWTEKGRAQ